MDANYGFAGEERARNQSFLALVHQTVNMKKDEVFATWYNDHGKTTDKRTFGSVWEESGIIAQYLSHEQKIKKGDCAVLCYNFGLHFLSVFLACLRAGITAVLVYPPNPLQLSESLSKMVAVINDCSPSVILMDSSIKKLHFFDTMSLNLMSKSKDLWPKDIPYIVTDTFKRLGKIPFLFEDVKTLPSDIAFLQYTSGSTGNPKGVMVTFGALAANVNLSLDCLLQLYRDDGGIPEPIVGFSWLPQYHDLGLVTVILTSLAGGFHIHMMSPLTFIRNPLLWLELMSRNRVNWGAAPDFAYRLVARKFQEKKTADKSEPIPGLDLSSIRNLLCAAEPIRPNTVMEFSKTFSEYNLRKNWFQGGYGLAEHVAGVCFVHEFEISSPQGKEEASQQTFVASGRRKGFHKSLTVKIVDTQTFREVPDGQTGELWLAGPSVAKGYYKKEDLSREVFCAKLAAPKDHDDCERTFLRTGDLAFFQDNNLFICGRIKDLIIHNGVNYYPQDVEFAVERASDTVRPGCVAAFSSDDNGYGGELEVVFEIRKTGEESVSKVIDSIQCCVRAKIGLAPSRIVAIKERSIPKTTSGKIQRRKTRMELHSNKLSVICDWESMRPQPFSEKTIRLPTRLPTQEINEVECPSIPEKVSSVEMLDLVRSTVASVLGVASEDIPLDRPLAEFGMTSAMAVELAESLSKAAGKDFPISMAFEGDSTMKGIAAYLSGLKSPLTNPLLASEPQSGSPSDPVAIIGTSCRFPGGVESPEDFWNLLISKTDAIKEVPVERWDADKYFHPIPGTRGKTVSKWGGFIENVELFDPVFFSMSPKEAESLDPQARLLLECCWEAFESGGILRDELNGSKTGVYMGISGNDHTLVSMNDPQSMNSYSLLGNMNSATVGRISYMFGLCGPNMAIDTACSSSLVAVHQACASLRMGECNMALAGGINLVLAPHGTVAISQTGALSPSGRCRAFSADADGYVRSDGCGIVLLKPLAAAIRDGDRIRGVIRGSSVNQDGMSQGLTAPRGDAQQAVIHNAMKQAHVSPSEISYVECHGTGTKLGDSVEVHALGSLFSEGYDRESKLILGSVKSNIGHTEAASGIAGLLKTLISMEKEMVPATIHTSELSPSINFDSLPVQVATQSLKWGRSKKKRFAGVSSFGISGTNAHLVLEEAPLFCDRKAIDSENNKRLFPIVLSAYTENSIKKTARRLHDYVSRHSDLNIADISYTLAKRTAISEHRAGLIIDSRSSLLEKLEKVGRGETPIGCTRKSKVGSSKLCMLFTGQGSQHPGMGRDLYNTQPVFRDAMDDCAEHFGKYLDKPLLHIMFADSEEQEAMLDRTDFTQAALFALEYALFHLWSSWGIVPDMLVGHSIGEIVAATVAGVFELADACKLVAMRGCLMRDFTKGGRMVVVQASELEVRSLITPWLDDVDIAAINSSNQTVFSGTEAAILSFTQQLEALGVKVKQLNVNHAFHSRCMDPILSQYREVVESMKLHTPSIPIFTCSLGSPINSDLLTKTQYWVDHIRETVHFAEAVGSAFSQGASVFLELGPALTLSGLVTTIAASNDKQPTILPSLSLHEQDHHAITKSLCSLFCAGVPINWNQYFQGGSQMIDLPTYAFDHSTSESYSNNAKDWDVASSAASFLSRTSQTQTTSRPSDVGIIAMDYYAPSLCVSASDVEELHSCKGRYTSGRGQEQMTFCSDDEDAVSMAMTVLERLIKRCKLNYSDIGRLEVGTESQVDRSKSIKTFLMAMFENEGVFDVEGIDTYNACYGGTNALFNAVNWVESSGWNGKFAVVICTDVAVHSSPDKIAGIGASALALLVGPGAPMVIEAKKATFMKHSWDFYRPIGWHNNDVQMDVDVATAQYEEALHSCQDGLCARLGTDDLLSVYDYAIFHCNAPYHARRSLQQLCEKMYKRKVGRDELSRLYKTYTEPSTTISGHNAVTYTCTLYACLLSLIINVGEEMIGRRILCFSYGSGCAASLFGIKLSGMPLYPANAIEKLQSRTLKTTNEALRLMSDFEDTYGKFGFEPSHTSDRQQDTFYLQAVNKHGVRTYVKHKNEVIKTSKLMDGKVMWIELLQDVIDASFIDSIIGALDPNCITVFTSKCNNFCVGASTGGSIDEVEFVKGLPKYGELLNTLMEKCPLPIVVLCHGATLGGGMLFPAVADLTLSMSEATFGFPEVRRGVLPALVSVAARKRMHHQSCKRWMLTGSSFDATTAMENGLVDAVLPGSADSAHRQLRELIKSIADTPFNILQAKKHVQLHHGSPGMAIVESGKLAIIQKEREMNSSVSLQWFNEHVALLSVMQNAALELSTISSLARLIRQLRTGRKARTIILDLTHVDSAGDISSLVLNNVKPQHGVGEMAAIMCKACTDCAQLLHSIRIPVIALLDGKVSGPALALALSTNIRVATTRTTLDFSNAEWNYVLALDRTMKQLVGTVKWNSIYVEKELDTEKARRVGLVSAAFPCVSGCLEWGKELAEKTSSSPQEGLRGVLDLMKEPSLDSLIAERCATFARKVCRNKEELPANEFSSPILQDLFPQKTDRYNYATVSQVLIQEMASKGASHDANINIHCCSKGVVRLKLPEVAKFGSILSHLNNCESLAGIIIDATDYKKGEALKNQNEFCSLVKNLADITKFTRALKALPAPVCTLLDGSVSTLALIVASASDFRIGTVSTLFDLATLLAEDVPSILIQNALVESIGLSQTDKLISEPRVIPSQESLLCGLLTKLVNDISTISDNDCLFNSTLALPLKGTMSEALSLSSEDAEFCVSVAVEVAQKSSHIMMPKDSDDSLYTCKKESTVHLHIRSPLLSLSPISKAVDGDSVLVVLHFEMFSNGVGKSHEANMHSLVEILAFLERIEIPLVLVCPCSDISKLDNGLVSFIHMFNAVADVSIGSKKLHEELQKRNNILRYKDLDIVVDTNDIQGASETIISQLRRVDNNAQRVCKKNIPLTCAETAILLQAGFMNPNREIPTRSSVKLDVLGDGVAIVELNNAARFNCLSEELLEGIRACLLRVEHLSATGAIKAMVLQGNGPHFCAGCWDPHSDEVNDAVYDIARIQSHVLAIGTLIRSLSIPTIAAVHGRVIGDGLALALTADVMICSEDTSFCVGNLPSGRSFLFLMSLNLPETVGGGFANRMYLEDLELDAKEAIDYGLVCKRFDTPQTTKSKALDLARSLLIRQKSLTSRGGIRIKATDIACKELCMYRTSKCSRLGNESIVDRLHPQVTTTRVGKLKSTVVQSYTTWEVFSEVEKTVRSLLGAGEATIIARDAPLHEMGFDSLATAELVRTLSEQFSLELPVMTVHNFPTIESISTHIFGQIKCHEDIVSKTNKTPIGNEVVVDTDRDTTESTVDSWCPEQSPKHHPVYILDRQKLIRDLLVCFRKGCIKRPPMVLIHGGSGSTYGTQLLPLLDEDQPIYGTQAYQVTHLNEDNGLGLQRRIDFYFEAIRDTFNCRTTGIHFVAFSFGSIVAFELAARFEAANVPFTLTLLDPVPQVFHKVDPPKQLKQQLLRKALRYESFFSELEVAKEVSTNKVTSMWQLDHAVFKYLGGNEDMMNDVQLCMEIENNSVDEMLEWSEWSKDIKLPCVPTIFTLESGLDWFRQPGRDYFVDEDAERDNVYGWSSRFNNGTSHISGKGSHLDFFKSAENVESLARHLSNLEIP